MTGVAVLSDDAVRAIVREAVADALAGHGAPALLTREQAAEYLAVSPTTLDEMAGEGRIPRVRHSARAVRFRRADLDRYVSRMDAAS